MSYNSFSPPLASQVSDLSLPQASLQKEFMGLVNKLLFSAVP